jgi:phage gp36-like protein
MPDGNPKDTISKNMQALGELVEEVKTQVEQFKKKKGWLLRQSKTKKKVAELKQLAVRIQQTVRNLTNHVQLVATGVLLEKAPPPLPAREHSFPVEDALVEHGGEKMLEGGGGGSLMAVAKAAGYSTQALQEELQAASSEVKEKLEQMGLSVEAMLERYAERLLEEFEQMRAEQQAMETRLQTAMEAAKEDIKGHIDERADKVDAQGKQMLAMLQDLVSRQDASTVAATPEAAQAQQLLMQGVRSMAKGDEQAGLARLDEADALLKKDTRSAAEGSKQNTAFDAMHADVALARGLAMQQVEGEQLSSAAAQALKQAVEGRPELAEQMKRLRPDEYRDILAEASQHGKKAAADEKARKEEEQRAKKAAADEKARKEEEQRAKKAAAVSKRQWWCISSSVSAVVYQQQCISSSVSAAVYQQQYQ